MGKVTDITKELNRRSHGVPSKEWPLDQVVARCKKNEKAAWQELISRYIKTIVKEIKSTFKYYYQESLGQDSAIVQDIVNELVIGLIEKGYIAKLDHPEALYSWLKGRARWETLNWFRKQNRNEDVLNAYGRKDVVSIDDFLNEESGLTVEDAIGVNEIEDIENQEEEIGEAEDALSNIKNLGDEERLIMKAVLLFYEPLTEAEIALIARMRKLPMEGVKGEIDQITDRLLRKNDKRIKEEHREIILWATLHKLEGKLTYLRNDPLADEHEMDDIEREINEKYSRLEKKRENKGKENMIRPTNKEIARLVGIAEERTKEISGKLFRIRKNMKKN